MSQTTGDFIEALRRDVIAQIREEVLAELKPLIEQRVYGNTFDLKEAARYRGVSESTMRRMVEGREIPFFRQRGQLFFRQTDLDSNAAMLIQNNS